MNQYRDHKLLCNIYSILLVVSSFQLKFALVYCQNALTSARHLLKARVHNSSMLKINQT